MAVRPPQGAVRPARAGNLDKVILNYRAIQRTSVFDKKNCQQGDYTLREG
jgi:hypothetical protein